VERPQQPIPISMTGYGKRYWSVLLLRIKRNKYSYSIFTSLHKRELTSSKRKNPAKLNKIIVLIYKNKKLSYTAARESIVSRLRFVSKGLKLGLIKPPFPLRYWSVLLLRIKRNKYSHSIFTSLHKKELTSSKRKKPRKAQQNHGSCLV
jgi:hypothetical protein